MKPKFIAPKVWRRPYTSIYNDNYRFGNSLYSGAIEDIERKYHVSMARTNFRSDRPDMGFQSFAEQLSPTGSSDRNRALASAAAAGVTLDAELADHTRSLSASRAINYSSEEASSRRLQHSNSFDAYQSQRALADMRTEIEESKARRSRSRVRRRPESSYNAVSAFEDALLSNSSADGHSQSFWMERCRELQAEIDHMNQQLSETESKIKHEAAHVKNKLNTEVADLMIAIDEQDRQTSDMQKMIKRQAKQISDLTLNYEAAQRQYGDTVDQLAQIQRRCQIMCVDIDEMRGSLDKQSVLGSTSRRRGWQSY